MRYGQLVIGPAGSGKVISSIYVNIYNHINDQPYFCPLQIKILIIAV